MSRLIKAGHSFSEIQNYTSAQIKLFLESAAYLEQEERAIKFSDSALSSSQDSKAIKAHFDKIKKDL